MPLPCRNLSVSTLVQLSSPTKEQSPKGSYAFVSLGCAKNLVDSDTTMVLSPDSEFFRFFDSDGDGSVPRRK